MARRRQQPPQGESGDSAFLTTAMSEWRTAETAEGGGAGSMRFEGELDLKFLNLQQWDENDERDRLAENKPTLVIDQIGEPYRQLTGALRRAKPAIQFNPIDSKGDIELAEIAQGLYRHIEQTGGAKAARDEAAKGMCGPGWGYYRLITEFEYDQAAIQPLEDGTFPPEAFDQCIKYQAIENQFTVFRDPACPLHEPWKARYCFIVEDVPLDTFKAKWPDAKSSEAEAFQSTGLAMPEWFPEGSVRVADYFYVEEVPGTEIAQLADGRIVPLAAAPAGVAIVQRRVPMVRKVMLAKITGAEILEGNADKTAGREFPSDYIPVIPMYGESIVVNGKRNIRGIVRSARDAQRMYNFHASELVYELALAPKSKVVMAEGQQEGYEEMWKQAPVKAFPALIYKPTNLMGQPVPPPSVAQFTDPAKIQAITVTLAQNKADLRSTTGWYDPTDPNRKNSDQSGRAILARREAQAEGSVNYNENFGAALLYEAMVGWSMIRRLYARPGRVLRIVGLDDAKDVQDVVYGQPRPNAKNEAIKRAFEWGAAKFDFVVTVGVGHASKRQEAADAQIEVMKVLPPEMAAAMAPSAVRNMDWPGAQETADRLERALPEQLRDPKDGEEDDPAALKAKLAQSEQMRQEAMQVVQQLQEAVKTDQVRVEGDLKKAQLTAQADAQKTQQSDAVKLEIAAMDAAHKATIEREKIQAEIAIAQMKIQADMQLAQMKIDAELEKAKIAAEAAAQARREGFVHDDLSAEQGHHHAMQQQASKPNGSANA